jgi:hypothetical protein
MPNPVYQPTPVYRTALFLSQLVARLPIGTNLALAHLLFTLLAGHLLQSRGAIFPALATTGLTNPQVRAAQAALREGKWTITYLLKRLDWLIRKEDKVIAHQIDGWQPMPLDWVGFYRPRLKRCQTKHFNSQAQRALPAIELGMVAKLKKVGDRLVACLITTTRSGDTVELLKAAKAQQGKRDVLLADSQVKISHLNEANIERFVVRGATNLTFRRSTPRPAKPGARGRKPTLGEVIRPLPRTFKGKVLPGNGPDRVETFREGKYEVVGLFFDSLVVAGCPGEATKLQPLVFSCLVIYHPKYKKPWVLLTDVQASAETIFLLYRCRWPIESLPQTGKELLGGHRSFVHCEVCTYRLPELCLLAGSLSQYLAATSPAVATGFWDRNPLSTPGRFARALRGAAMPDFDTLVGGSPRVRRKSSVHEHLPKGILGHRRQRRQAKTPSITGN